MNSVFEFLTGDKRKFRDAAERGDVEALRKMLRQGADVESRSDFGSTALHKACGHGHLNAARLLLECGADLWLTTPKKDGKTALQEAVLSGNNELIALIGEWARRNPQPMLAVDTGQGVLQTVASAGDAVTDVVGSALQSAASSASKLPRQVHELVTNDKRLFRDLCEAGDLDGANELLEGGADVESRSEYGSTALHKACSAGQLAIVRLLLQHGADITLTTPREGGSTPYKEAEGQGHTAVMNLLERHERELQRMAVLNRAGQGRDSSAAAIALLRSHGRTDLSDNLQQQQIRKMQAGAGAGAGAEVAGVYDATSEAGKKLVERGDKLSSLADKTTRLATQAKSFANAARQCRERKEFGA